MNLWLTSICFLDGLPSLSRFVIDVCVRLCVRCTAAGHQKVTMRNKRLYQCITLQKWGQQKTYIYIIANVQIVWLEKSNSWIASPTFLSLTKTTSVLQSVKDLQL